MPPGPEGGDARPQAINLRDLSDVSPALRKGVLFRCSQIYSPELLQELHVRTVVDLRGRSEVRRHSSRKHQPPGAEPPLSAAGRAAAAPAGAAAAAAASTDAAAQAGSMHHVDSFSSEHSSGSESDTDARSHEAGGDGVRSAAQAAAAALLPPEALDPDVIGRLVEGGEPPAKALAAVTGGSRREAEVVAVPSAEGEGARLQPGAGGEAADAADAVRLTFDVIPAKEFGKAMLRMPLGVWRVSLGNVLSGRDPRKPFVDAFADEQLLGFTKYYVLILEHSRKNLAAVMRVFAQPSSLPALVHCAHGKDRTGVVVLLLLLACGVSPEAIVADYVQSEVQLRQYRASLGLDSATAAGAAIARTLIPLDDAIIASTADTMRAVLKYLSDTYGSPDAYLTRRLGLSEAEVAAIRAALMTPEALHAMRGGGGGAGAASGAAF